MLRLRWFLKGCIVSAACHGAIGPKTAHWLLSVLGHSNVNYPGLKAEA